MPHPKDKTTTAAAFPTPPPVSAPETPLLPAPSLDLPEILDVIVTKALAAMRAKACGIFRWDADREVFSFVAVRGLSERFQRGFALASHEGVSGHVLREGGPVWTDDVLADPRNQLAPKTRELVQAEGFRSVLAVPIRLPGEFFGTLVTYHWQSHQFREDEIRFQAALADQAAIAIENARLFERERKTAARAERQRVQAEALAAVGRAISASLDVDRLLEVLVERTAVATGADGVAVLERETTTGTVRFRRGHGLSTHYWKILALPPGVGIVGEALSSRRPQWTPDIQTDSRYPVPADVQAHNAAEGVHGILTVPVRGSDEPYGVLNLYWRTPRALDDEEVTFALRIADQAAVAIENARLFHQEHERRRQVEMVRAVTEEITRELDLPVLMGLVHLRAVELVGGVSGCIYLWDEAGQVLVPQAWHGRGEWVARVRLRPGEGVAGTVAQRRAGLIVNDYRSSPYTHPLVLEHTRVVAYISEPLLYRDRLLGVITVNHEDSARRFTEQDGEALALFAGQAAIAIENARLYAEAQAALETIRRQHAAAQALLEVSQALTRTLELDRLFDLIVEKVLGVTGAEACGISRITPAGELEYVRARGFYDSLHPPTSLPSGEGVMGRCLEVGGPVWSRDSLDDPAIAYRPETRARVAAEGMHAGLAVPIITADRPYGVLYIGRRRPHDHTPQEVDFAQALAAQAAIAIENAQLYAGQQAAYEQLKAAQDHAVQVEKLRALGEMAGGVAHDFNNLLTGILGQAQLLKLRSADLDVHERAGLIEQAALDGAETVRRILGFARTRAEAAYAPVDLGVLLPQVLEVTRPRWKDEAQRRGATIEAVLALEPVPPVLGNAAELREVLVNLIFNAVDALPRGGRITLGARRGPDGPAPPPGPGPGAAAGAPAETVEIVVRDTGVGMPEAVRRRALDPFFTTKGVKGSGLGLSMVYGIVSRHGGALLLESREGVGTIVTVRLPVAAQAPAPPAEAALPPAGRRGRLVVVDDEEALADVLAEILRLQGHEVAVFTEPQRALDHLAGAGADLLFTDLGMPELSGWDVTRHALALHPGLPVILVTGWGQQIEPAQVRARGVAALVAKPYRMEEILGVVAKLLTTERDVPTAK